MDQQVPDMEVIERQKENIIPLKEGRKASVLTNLYNNFENEAARQRHLAKERERFEAEIDSKNLQDLDDPLDVYHRFVRWIQESYPAGQNAESDLVHVLEKCLTTFKHDSRYKNDPRYVKLWLLYASLMDDSLPIFQFLTRNGIGQDLASYYEAYAEYLEQHGKCRAADDTFQLGLSRKAQPFERLSRKYKEFQKRLLTSVLVNEDESEDAASLEQQMPSFSGTQLSAAQVPLCVFSDSGAPNDPPSVEPAWLEIGTRQHRRKENFRQPEVWSETEGIKCKTASRALEPIAVYADPETSSSKPGLALSGGFGALLRSSFPNAGADTRATPTNGERINVNLSLIYRDDGQEFCFEELHAMALKARKVANVLKEKTLKSLAPSSHTGREPRAIFSPLKLEQSKTPIHSISASVPVLKQAEQTRNIDSACKGKLHIGKEICSAASTPVKVLSRDVVNASLFDSSIRLDAPDATPTPRPHSSDQQSRRDVKHGSRSTPVPQVDAFERAALSNSPAKAERLAVSPTINTKAALADVYDWFSQTLPLEKVQQNAYGASQAYEDDTIPVLQFESKADSTSGSDFCVFRDPTVTMKFSAPKHENDKATAQLADLSISRDADVPFSGTGPFNLLDDSHLQWLFKKSKQRFSEALAVVDEDGCKFETLSSVAKYRKKRVEFPMKHKTEYLSILEALGEGAYAKVFLVSTSDGSLRALKVQKSPVAWEFSMIERVLQSQLDQSVKRHMFTVASCAQYRNETLLLLDSYSSRLTLLDAVNWFGDQKEVSGALCGFPEPLALQFAAQFIGVLQHVHSVNILHGDFKADNIMLYVPEKRDRVSFKLIDWGRSMDLSLLPEQMALACSLREKDESIECWEMRYGAPFTFEPDWYGLAGVLHVMLYGQYLRINQRSTWDDENNYGTSFLQGPDDAVNDHLGTYSCVKVWQHFPAKQLPKTPGSKLATLISESNADGLQVTAKIPRAALRSPLKRYWQTSIWQPLFDFLLNSGTYSRAVGKINSDYLELHPLAGAASDCGLNWTIRNVSQYPFKIGLKHAFGIEPAVAELKGYIEQYLNDISVSSARQAQEKKLLQYVLKETNRNEKAIAL